MGPSWRRAWIDSIFFDLTTRMTEGEMLCFLDVLLLWSQIFSIASQGVIYTFLPGVCQKYGFIDGDGDNDTSK